MSKFIKARFRKNIHLKTKIKTLFSMRSYISILNLFSAQKNVIKLKISKDRKSTRLNSSHCVTSRMPSSA